MPDVGCCLQCVLVAHGVVFCFSTYVLLCVFTHTFDSVTHIVIVVVVFIKHKIITTLCSSVATQTFCLLFGAFVLLFSYAMFV